MLYGQFMSKVNELKVKYGHEVEVMWECEWLQRRKNDLSIQTFLQSYRKPELLDPQEALFGGRTTAILMKGFVWKRTKSYVQIFRALSYEGRIMHAKFR